MAHRVLQLISSAGFFGAESVLVELSVCLNALGEPPVVGVLDHGAEAGMQIAQVARKRGLRVQPFACRGALDWRAIRAIDAFARDQGISVVHSHGYKSNTYALLASRDRPRKLVSTCHNWIDASAKMRLYSALDRMVLRRFDAVVPVSMSVREALVRAGFRSDTLSVIENGIDTTRFGTAAQRDAVRAELGFDERDFVVGVIGRLSEEKGQSVLIDALARIDAARLPWRLLLVGDGPLRVVLEAGVRECGLGERVTFAGRRDDVPRLLAGIDLVALPSLIEAQPMALLEAMAAGVPVLATRVGDVPRILGDGALGILVEPGDPAQLTDAIRRSYGEMPDLRERAGVARQDVAARRSSAGMARAYADLYERLN